MKFQLVFCLAVTFLYISSGEEAFECTDGTPYKQNYCNTCWCVEGSGLLGCTKMYCEHSSYWRNCTAGTSFNDDCNSCRCVKGLGTICTNFNCTNIPPTD